MKHKTVFTLFFMLAALLTIRAEYYGPEWQLYLFKPLTLMILIVFAVMIPDFVSKPYRRFIIIGLLFSMCGDIFLMLPHNRFIWGLLSFLVAHISYIVAFRSPDSIRLNMISGLLLLCFGLIIFSLIKADLGNLQLPVIVYTSVILFMVWTAISRFLLLRTGSTRFVR